MESYRNYGMQNNSFLDRRGKRQNRCRQSRNALLSQAMEGFHKKLVVLDDDPTGVQTVHDVSVYTDWEEESIRNGFEEKEAMFFILTNSRSFSVEETTKVHQDIAARVAKVARELGQDFMIISRGDSTLRGHYPLETQLLAEDGS